MKIHAERQHLYCKKECSPGGGSIAAGTRVDEGSKVVLVVGRGKGDAKVIVPNLIGKKLSEARSLLLSRYLTVGFTEFDEQPTEETEDLFIVYKQEPSSGNQIIEGSRVDIYLSTNIEKAMSAQNHSDEDDFF